MSPDSENMDIPKEKPVLKTEPVKLDMPIEKKKSEVKKEEAAKCLEEAAVILKEYGGLTSNIPINHTYWDLMNRHAGAHEEWKRLSALNL